MEEMQPCHPPAPSSLLLPLLPPLLAPAAASYIRSLADGRSQDPPPCPGFSACASTALSQQRPDPPFLGCLHLPRPEGITTQYQSGSGETNQWGDL